MTVIGMTPFSYSIRAMVIGSMMSSGALTNMGAPRLI